VERVEGDCNGEERRRLQGGEGRLERGKGGWGGHLGFLWEKRNDASDDF
jgi:hypothetical protein